MDKWVGGLSGQVGRCIDSSRGKGVDKRHCSLLDSRGHNPLFLSSCVDIFLVFYVFDLFGIYIYIIYVLPCSSSIYFSFVNL